MRWVVLAALLVCFVFLQRALWFTTSSVPHGTRLAAQVAAQREKNGKLAERNAQLWEEVKDLKRGGSAIEEHARMDLGLVKKGETFYQIVRVPQGATAAAAASAAAPATRPHGG